MGYSTVGWNTPFSPCIIQMSCCAPFCFPLSIPVFPVLLLWRMSARKPAWREKTVASKKKAFRRFLWDAEDVHVAPEHPEDGDDQHFRYRREPWTAVVHAA
jgi:hypothetical protein